ncbi:Acylphosphatase-like domain-containing protein [Rhexocercosporidium sp. MPI-PUGE-AT-0058]|nr:Acylphosphatase-like domain-containing protein [Rhexocercosporidium sp. MPI-PUGE-AT-0058]
MTSQPRTSDLAGYHQFRAEFKMVKRLSFRVHGDVQGVGFRYFTRKKASSYGLTGWVRNTPDNQVEGEAQGGDDVLQKFMKDVDSGPSHATVDKVEKKDIDVVDGETGFEVRR